MYNKNKYLGFYLIALIMLFGCGPEQQEDDFTARMAEEHKTDTPTPTPITHTDGAEVSGEMVEYGRIGDTVLTGYMAVPDGAEGPLPAVVVIHEWWGLNDNVKMMADKIAAEGYRALAVDIYNGNVAETPDQARQFMGEAMQNPEQPRQNMLAAYTYLTETHEAPKVGSIGWCFGGGMSLNLALALPDDLDAAVMYYGRVVTDPAQLATLQMPILGLFGGEDQGIPVASVQDFSTKLDSLGKDAAIHIYDGAGHAFANPSGQNYVAEAAEDAWTKTTDFFAMHLK